MPDSNFFGYRGSLGCASRLCRGRRLENYNVTESAIRNEAKAAGDMAQLSYALPESQGEEMRRLLDAYVKEVQQSEWGTMAQGLPSKAAADALAHLTQATINMQVGQMRIWPCSRKRYICWQ